MPQLVKGGKYVFGWTGINSDYNVQIPDEAMDEYKIYETEKLIILQGSKSSGGFSIVTPNSIMHSKLSENIIKLIGYRKETNSFTSSELEIVKYGEKRMCWTSLENEKYFKLSMELITSFNINFEDKLLVVGGSGLGPAFIVKGKIYEEALKHDLPEFN